MSLAGRELGPLPNPWCVWSKCGEPAIRGLGARWPSRFSAERFSDRIEGQAHAVAALNHGISALFTTRAPTCEGSPDLPAQTSEAFGLRQSKRTLAILLDVPAIPSPNRSPTASLPVGLILARGHKMGTPHRARKRDTWSLCNQNFAWNPSPTP